MSACSVCHQPLTAAVSWTQLALGKVTPGLCVNCLANLSEITTPGCRHCGRQLAQAGPAIYCPDCLTWEGGPLIANRSLAERNPWLTEVIHRFKYRYDYQVMLGFKPLVRAFMADYLSELSDVVLVPVPLSAERLAVRKFNQAEVLADMSGFVVDACLSRVESEAQAKKSKHDRFKSPNPFRLTHLPEATTVILVDDVYTTGVTVHHAAAVLKEAGVSAVYSFTLAR